MRDLPIEGGVRVRGVELACRQFGSGPPLLMLHGGAGPTPRASYLDALAAHFEIILPTHPGFYGSPHHKRVGSVDDLAYLYLDLIDDFGLDALDHRRRAETGRDDRDTLTEHPEAVDLAVGVEFAGPVDEKAHGRRLT